MGVGRTGSAHGGYSIVTQYDKISIGGPNAGQAEKVHKIQRDTAGGDSRILQTQSESCAFGTGDRADSQGVYYVSTVKPTRKTKCI